MAHDDSFNGGFHIMERFRQLPGRLDRGASRLVPAHMRLSDSDNFFSLNQRLTPYQEGTGGFFNEPRNASPFLSTDGTRGGGGGGGDNPLFQGLTGSRNTGAGYNGPGANRSVHRRSASDSWGNVQGAIARARFNELKAGLDQLRKAQASGGGGNSIINARIGRAKDELSQGNKLFDDFFEDIAPGFEEALASAGRIAEAEAAIEGHFNNTQEAIDERYATAEGGIIAIADSMGNASESLQEALHTSVFEFKEFIDADLHLDKNQAQALNAAASSLAVAAAEASSAQARGAGARDQFTFQKRYEKIIQNLLDQRAAASAARGNALRGAAEQLLSNFRAEQPFTRVQMGNKVMDDMINQVIPPAQQNLGYMAVRKMLELGVDNWDDFRLAIQIPFKDAAGITQTDWATDLDRQLWVALTPYANVLESAVNQSTQLRIDELYNQAFQDPQTTFDRFNVGREEAFEAGFNFQGATNYANQQLLVDGSALTDLGSILDQLDPDVVEALFGRGLGG